MILPSVARGARNIASGFLLICGALTQAKGHVAIDQDTQAAQVETAASNTVNKDPETGDAAIGTARPGAAGAPRAAHPSTTAR